MRIIDVTGKIKDGMWSYEPPFPTYHLKPLPEVPWVKDRVWCEIFDGLHSQCGTYLETPAHFFGNDNCYLLEDLPAEKLCDIPAVLISLPVMSPKDEREGISAEDLEHALGDRTVPEGCALLVGCGWGKYWFDGRYLSKSPYFKRDAMEWLIRKKPFLLGSDIARWENLERPEGFFFDFYKADILMLAPLVKLEEVDSRKNLLLTALPLAVTGTSCAPARAIIKEL